MKSRWEAGASGSPVLNVWVGGLCSSHVEMPGGRLQEEAGRPEAWCPGGRLQEKPGGLRLGAAEQRVTVDALVHVSEEPV